MFLKKASYWGESTRTTFFLLIRVLTLFNRYCVFQGNTNILVMLNYESFTVVCCDPMMKK